MMKQTTNTWKVAKHPQKAEEMLKAIRDSGENAGQKVEKNGKQDVKQRACKKDEGKVEERFGKSYKKVKTKFRKS